MKTRMVGLVLVLLSFLGAPQAFAQAPAQPHVVFLLAQDPETAQSQAVIQALTARFPQARVSPVFSSIPRAQLRAMLDEARRNHPTAQVPELFRYHRVDVRNEREAHAVVRWLERRRGVDNAYVSYPAIPAPPPVV
jgi:hypothetical protein